MPMNAAAPSAYHPRRVARSQFVKVRTLNMHLHTWGDASLVTPERAPVVMVHGWMDVGASFQFVVDALAHDRYVIAPDWRGFGLTQGLVADNFWFGDYLGDLDGLLDALGLGSPEQPIDLVGHSMGGNIAMIYAGVCPTRIRTLINLEGFGMPRTDPKDARGRYAGWLHQLKNPVALKDYDSLDAVAARMQKNNPRLPLDRARWLANHWAHRTEAGRWVINGDPAHKRLNPQLYRVEEALACWAAITAPMLVVEASIDETPRWWGNAYPRSEFHERLEVVPDARCATVQDAGHMLHHDQPQALAELLENFWADAV